MSIKVEIKDRVLILTPETGIENYALNEWFAHFNNSSVRATGIGLNSFVEDFSKTISGLSDKDE